MSRLIVILLLLLVAIGGLLFFLGSRAAERPTTQVEQPVTLNSLGG